MREIGIKITTAIIRGNFKISMSNKKTSMHAEMTPTVIFPIMFDCGTSFNLFIEKSPAESIIRSLKARAIISNNGNPLKTTREIPTAMIQILSATGSRTRPVIDVAFHFRARKPSR